MFNEIRQTKSPLALNESSRNNFGDTDESLEKEKEAKELRFLTLDKDYYSLAMFAFLSCQNCCADEMDSYIIRSRNTKILTKITLIFFIQIAILGFLIADLSQKVDSG
jgi:hypothetical protein